MIIGISPALVYWNRESSSEFIVYRLGDYYMEEYLRTTDSALIVSLQQLPGNYFSVAALVEQTKPGVRSLATDVLRQGVECYVRSFVADLVDSKVSRLRISLGSIYDLDSVYIEKLTQSGFQAISSYPADGSTFEMIDTLLQQGVNTYRIKLVTKSGTSIYSPTETVYFFSTAAFIFYPNPIRGNQFLNILSADTDDVEVQFFDVAGRPLLRKRLINQIEQISTIQFPKGLILYRISRNKVVQQVGRLVIL